MFPSKHELNQHVASQHPHLKICRFFKENRCMFGDDCIFNHDLSEKDTTKFTCNICDREFQVKHDLMMHRKNYHQNKLLLCRNYFKGECANKESSCWYRHIVKSVKENKDFYQRSLIDQKK